MTNEEYTRKVLPFLKIKYFEGKEHQIVFDEIDKFEMEFQAKFYQKNGISKEKLKTFCDTVKIEIKDKNWREILSNIIE